MNRINKILEANNKFYLYALFLSLLFIVSRLLIYKMGIRFLADSSLNGWQVLDLYYLKNDALRSIFYMHSQPPLWNLILSAALKISDENHLTILRLFFICCGYILCISTFFILVHIKFRLFFACFVSFVFVTMPAPVLYENWLFYTYPLAALLSFTTLWMIRYIKNQSIFNGLILFSCIGLVPLLRNSYHLIWLLMEIGILLVASRIYWKRTICFSLIPLCLVGGLLIKNLIIFGIGSSSSWLGMNLAATTVISLPQEEQQRLTNENKLSGISLIGRFQPLDKYPENFRQASNTGIAVLDESYKNNNDKMVNFNNIHYIEISNAFLKDDLFFIRNYPMQYLENVLEAFMIYIRPSNYYAFILDNSGKILDSIYFWHPIWITFSGDSSITILLTIICSLIIGLQAMYKLCSKAVPTSNKKLNYALLIIVGNIFYNLLVSVLIDIGENNRFRFPVESFQFICLLVFIRDIFNKSKSIICKNMNKNS